MKKIGFAFMLVALLSACGNSKNTVVTKSTSTVVEVDINNPVKDTIAASKSVKTIREVVKEEVQIKRKEELPEPEVFNHSGWDQLLKKYVSNDGRVNYEGFRNDKGILRDYIASLGVNMPAKTWTVNDKLAYWMNAYNAMTVDLIVRNLPLESIKNIDKPWNQRLWKLGDKWYNLNEIEHQILRKMGDARIHFGINCASFSCPPLLNVAFTSQTVDSQLDHLARTFVNDPLRNQISAKSLQLSKVFSWFAKDFKTNGSLIDFLNIYSEIMIDKKARKSFMEYNWSLNK
ncbi:MAG: DUF547 domain-containing protein [Flavobacteriaceae bacterium]|nr:DUF547 domain-containing protein [Flavobacteriaceae bacterium]